jgi:anti-anti-sigma factor
MPAVRHLAVRLLRGHGPRSTRRSRTPPSGTDVRTAKYRLAPGLVVASSYSGGTARIDVDGELDLATVGLLDEALAEVYQQRHGRRTVPDLVLDLTDVTFLDGIAIMSLHRIKELAHRDGQLRVGFPAHPGPRRLLLLAVDQGWLPLLSRPDGPSL